MDRQKHHPARALFFEDPILRQLLPEREALSMEEIALSLARIPRFLGHTHSMGRFPRRDCAHSMGRVRGDPNLIWSVAQHSVLVCDLAALVDEEIALAALLHDAHEALIGDITRPVQEVLEDLMGPALPGFGLSELKDRVQAVVHRELGLDWPLPKKTVRLIREADEQALAMELDDLVRPQAVRPKGPARTADPSRPVGRAPLRPLPPAQALELFMGRFSVLYKSRQKAREEEA